MKHYPLPVPPPTTIAGCAAHSAAIADADPALTKPIFASCGANVTQDAAPQIIPSCIEAHL